MLQAQMVAIDKSIGKADDLCATLERMIASAQAASPLAAVTPTPTPTAAAAAAFSSSSSSSSRTFSKPPKLSTIAPKRRARPVPTAAAPSAPPTVTRRQPTEEDKQKFQKLSQKVAKAAKTPQRDGGRRNASGGSGGAAPPRASPPGSAVPSPSLLNPPKLLQQALDSMDVLVSSGVHANGSSKACMQRAACLLVLLQLQLKQ
eukprot:GABV01008811.1.p1 GENE.GABV01008811.1~~GABV01008811.1.p1  ORF type:complete len:203 (-),score=85.75 GABV01008811.1:107-715(-)